MGVYEFTFPDVGEGIHEGTIVSWKVKNGEIVKQDQVLAEVETDKAVVEIPSPVDGKVKSLHGQAGAVIKVGDIIVTFEVQGEGKKAGGASKSSARDAAAKAGGVVGQIPESLDSAPVKKGIKITKNVSKNVSGVQATPAIRKLAQEFGVDIATVKGTGGQGQITAADLKGAIGGTIVPAHATSEQKKTESTPTLKKVRKYDMWGYVDHIPLKGMRKAIATHMEESWKAPLVTHHDEADVTELVVLREKQKQEGNKVSYLSYTIKAVIKAMASHPMLNAAFDRENEDIIVKKYFNIGIAVDTGDGLVVPVLKGADKKDLASLSKEIALYAEKAKSKKLDLMDMKGGTFTITNVGALGGTYFTPLLNTPEVAILGLGKMQDKAVVKEGKIVVRKVLPLSLSFDHRVVDGAEAARFVTDVISILQSPSELK